MKFFDRITDYMKVRRLDNREKILIIVFAIVFIEFLLFVFIYNPKIQIINAKDSMPKENIDVVTENSTTVKYTGLENFSEENIKIFLENTNLKPENISFETSDKSEVLKINFSIKREKLNDLQDIIKYYGFRNINISRLDIDTYNVFMEATKEASNTYYSDIRTEYFNPKKEKKIANQPEKIEAKPNDEKIINNSQNTKNIVKNNPPKKIKRKRKVINRKLVRKVEEKIENTEEFKWNLSESSIETRSFRKYVDLSNVEINRGDTYIYYSEESNILAIYVNTNEENDSLEINLKDRLDDLKFSIFIPIDYNSNIGVILKDDLYRSYSGIFEKNSWNNLDFNFIDIEKIRIELSMGENIILIGNINGKEK